MISNPQMRCVKSYLILSYQRRVHQLQKAHQQMRQSIASLQRHCITETAGCIRQHEKLQFQEMHRRRQTGGTRAESNPGEDLHGTKSNCLQKIKALIGLTTLKTIIHLPKLGLFNGKR
ncbi:uncharacterized protein [Ptychodera flava]|uniref:uncharacterized protein n=1 Tax=Ptychodera flava TaxID=63121 RepID=UPI00396A7C4D